MIGKKLILESHTDGINIILFDKVARQTVEVERINRDDDSYEAITKLLNALKIQYIETEKNDYNEI